MYIAITSLRKPEEEKKFYVLRKGGSNRHRQAVPAPNRTCGCRAFCPASVAAKKKSALRLGVSKVTAR
ncbi:MAG: hypothetical protein SOZ51_10100 [Eubacteriales bacterium]|nr:hypothetical protein [Eubacteriales bacterium]